MANPPALAGGCSVDHYILGVGMIQRDNAEACNNAINAVSYLSDNDKDDQYLRMKPRGRRAFATGWHRVRV